MKTKQIILIVIMVLILAVAGVFFYKSFSKNIKTEGDQALTNAVAANAGSKILPHGDNLNFDKVKEFNPNHELNKYPVVSPDDAKSQLNTIISQ